MIIDNEYMEYPLWEHLLEEDIQGIFDRRLDYGSNEDSVQWT